MFTRRALGRLFAALPFGGLAAKAIPHGRVLRDPSKVAAIAAMPPQFHFMTGYHQRRYEEILAREEGRYTMGCKLAGPGRPNDIPPASPRGDCEHFIGLPKTFKYPKDVNEYGIPHGWCDYCWMAHRLNRAFALAPLERTDGLRFLEIRDRDGNLMVQNAFFVYRPSDPDLLYEVRCKLEDLVPGCGRGYEAMIAATKYIES